MAVINEEDEAKKHYLDSIKLKRHIIMSLFELRRQLDLEDEKIGEMFPEYGLDLLDMVCSQVDFLDMAYNLMGIHPGTNYQGRTCNNHEVDFDREGFSERWLDIPSEDKDKPKKHFEMVLKAMRKEHKELLI